MHGSGTDTLVFTKPEVGLGAEGVSGSAQEVRASGDTAIVGLVVVCALMCCVIATGMFLQHLRAAGPRRGARRQARTAPRPVRARRGRRASERTRG